MVACYVGCTSTIVPVPVGKEGGRGRLLACGWHACTIPTTPPTRQQDTHRSPIIVVVVVVGGRGAPAAAAAPCCSCFCCCCLFSSTSLGRSRESTAWARGSWTHSSNDLWGVFVLVFGGGVVWCEKDWRVDPLLERPVRVFWICLVFWVWCLGEGGVVVGRRIGGPVGAGGGRWDGWMGGWMDGTINRPTHGCHLPTQASSYPRNYPLTAPRRGEKRRGRAARAGGLG